MDALVAAAAAVDVSMDEDGDDEMELEDVRCASAEDALPIPALEVADANKDESPVTGKVEAAARKVLLRP